MLSFSGRVIFNLTKESLSLKKKYPKVDCNTLASTYDGDEEQWMIEAF